MIAFKAAHTVKQNSNKWREHFDKLKLNKPSHASPPFGIGYGPCEAPLAEPWLQDPSYWS